MATYVNDLRLKEIGTGESSGTWGTETNTNLELIGDALGFGTEGITTNADTHTTTVADGSVDAGRAMYIKYTGTLDSACTVTIGPNTINRMHFIENATTGSQNLVISQGTGSNVTIPAGDVKAVYLDGAGSGAAVADAFASLSVVDLKVQDDLTVTDDATIGGTLGVTGIVTLTDDLIIGDGKTIGSASDVDAMTIASNGQVTFSQTLIGTALDISGDIDVDGTTNLDVVDIDGAVDMASTLQVDGAITSSAGATITIADNSAALTVKSTDADSANGPIIDLIRDSASPADNDSLGMLRFKADNDAGEETIVANIKATVVDVSDGSEDGRLLLQTMIDGTSRNRIEITNTEVVVNQSSVDSDFRVESNGNANMLFVDAGNDRVGIGTSSPASKLHITGTGTYNHSPGQNTTSDLIITSSEMTDNNYHSIMQLVSVRQSLSTGAYANGYLGFSTIDDSNAQGIRDAGRIAIVNENGASRNSATSLSFWTNAGGADTTAATEKMRIDSSGNLLVGHTSLNGTGGVDIGTSGYVRASRSGDEAAIFNRETNDGTIVSLQKDGTTVGSIANTGTSPIFRNVNEDGISILTDGGQAKLVSTNSSGLADNDGDIGAASYRWDDIYATNGTIQTSDRNEKQDIAELSDAETRVAVAAKGLLRKFRWQSAVEEKGDEARIHFGIIAQDLQDAFTAEGLDAGDYAMFISSTWTDDDGVEQTRLGVRYSELLAFIIAAI